MKEKLPIAACSGDIRDTKSGYMLGGIIGYATSEKAALKLLNQKFKNSLEMRCKFNIVVEKVLATDNPNSAGCDFYRYAICK